MEQDRELLELAALAAGLSVRYVSNVDETGSFYTEPDQLWWNPLVDDGDALRLAVKTKQLLACESCSSLALGKIGNEPDAWHGGGDDEHAGVDHDDVDPNAAMRLAIVRCAAEIGLLMKEQAC